MLMVAAVALSGGNYLNQTTTVAYERSIIAILPTGVHWSALVGEFV